ncbi:MAG: type II toxin-antitoxin system mRNA interferase toxin, RelE/StbE family [Candidatus Wildermuthbacteria bacterium]|nr:type II toxin-antitoxin system mRNA interferase toxin, RelE/StbE family [Candidatus Wildermuthbacteria bacterium]
MKILLHRHFEKQYKKLLPDEQRRFKERRDLFLEDEFHSSLNNHALRGKYAGCRSISVGGDLRVVCKRIAPDIVIFVIMGTHSELYS